MSPACRAHRSLNRPGAAVAPKIETEFVANTLRFQCPNTGRVIDSRISIHCSTRLISIRARCPSCENLHDWPVAGESFSAVAAERPSNDARLTNTRTVLRDFWEPNPDIIELREQLLDELNHRFKNNLQMLHSLLQSGWHKTNNSEVREVLSDTRRRIAAMGTAQQFFYAARNSTDVRARSFLEAVCINARAFFGKDVSIRCEAIAGSLPKETVMPLALVLNELLANAAKYGADDRGRVTVNVELKQRSGEIELHVQDHGSGFNFAEKQGGSSGLGLVKILAQRLRGTFTVERRSGARCVLIFPDQ
jgi:two-component sensor histidine kinase